MDLPDAFVGQAFAVNHPDRLRSLVLDGTYPLPGTDPRWATSPWPRWRALRLVCERRPSCAARGEDPLVALQRIADRVRARPLRGSGTDGEGRRIRVRLDIRALATLVQSGYGNLADVPRRNRRDPRVRGRRPRAAAAARGRDDARPEASPVRSFSDPLYLAVTCHDYPQMRDPAAPLATRRQQLAAARAALPARAVRAVHGYGVDLAAVRGRDRLPALAGPEAPRASNRPASALSRGPDAGRQRRPGQHHDHRPGTGGRVEVPELDLRRDAQHGPRVSARRPRRLCRSDRSPLHPHAERRRHELRRPDRRGADGRPVPTPLRGAAPADPRPGDRSTVADRRVAAVAVSTVADAIQRWLLNYDGSSRGLRGGRWTWSGDRLDALPLPRRALHPRRPGPRRRDLATRDRRGPGGSPGPRPRPAAGALERAPPARDGHAHRPPRRAPPAGDDARALNEPLRGRLRD